MSLTLPSSIHVLGLERVCPQKGCPLPWPRIFLCAWPWPRALRPRRDLWYQISNTNIFLFTRKLLLKQYSLFAEKR